MLTVVCIVTWDVYNCSYGSPTPINIEHVEGLEHEIICQPLSGSQSQASSSSKRSSRAFPFWAHLEWTSSGTFSLPDGFLSHKRLNLPSLAPIDNSSGSLPSAWSASFGSGARWAALPLATGSDLWEEAGLGAETLGVGVVIDFCFCFPWLQSIIPFFQCSVQLALASFCWPGYLHATIEEYSKGNT